MDALDARILRLLQWHPCNPVDARRQPLGLWDIARSLGVHGNTIKRRLNALQDEGVLWGMLLFPPSTFFGIHSSEFGFTFQDAEAARRGFEAVLAAGRQGLVQQLADHSVLNAVFCPAGADLQAAADAVAQQIGATAALPRGPGYWDHDEPTDLERRVAEALHLDAFATPPELAQRCGVTAKVVRRTVVSLRQKGLFRVAPIVDLNKCSGMVPVRLDVQGTTEAKVAVLQRFPDLLAPDPPQAPTMSLIGVVERQQDLVDTIETISGMQGIAQAQPQLEVRRGVVDFERRFDRVAESLARQADWEQVAG